MNWILFTGTWRLFNPEVERDVRKESRAVLLRGDGIVTGGATGVDYFAMTEALAFDPTGEKLKVFIPTNLNNYFRDYRKNLCQKPITQKEIDLAIECLLQLHLVKPEHIIMLNFDGDISQEHYSARHEQEVANSHEVYAFQVNNSIGTQDTIDKAVAAGLPITVHKKYQIEE